MVGIWNATVIDAVVSGVSGSHRTYAKFTVLTYTVCAKLYDHPPKYCWGDHANSLDPRRNG